MSLLYPFPPYWAIPLILNLHLDNTADSSLLEKSKSTRTQNYLVPIWDKITNSAGINCVMGNWKVAQGASEPANADFQRMQLIPPISPRHAVGILATSFRSAR
jgi:hypothetical protein